jgi:hypothetical protein
MMSAYAHVRSRTRSAGGALPALFAMLILLVGPLLSQAVSLSHASPSPHACHETADVHGLHAIGDMPARTAHAAGHTDAHGHAIWAKCGYCDLLLTCPAVGGVGYVSVATPPHGVAELSARWVDRARPSPVFPGARSRAPPFPLDQSVTRIA